jgi:hypothetical protein
MKKPTVNIIGEDGNAFSILGACFKAAKKAGWTQEKIDDYQEKATSGDYKNLLAVTEEMFDVK